MSKRVLILENDKAQREAEEILVHNLGWDTVGVSSADDAIAVVKGGALFDLIIMDIIMPRKTGLDFVAEVGVKCPIIVTTGYYEGTNVPGVVAVLTKPFDFKELELEVKRIEKSLENKKC